MKNDGSESNKRSHAVLLVIGAPAILFTSMLAGRIVWEETSLTWQQGPQMIGFSLAHGMWAALLLAPIALVLWLVVALIAAALSLSSHMVLARKFWASLILAAAMLGILILPPFFWQWLFIGSFARSVHAADLMTYAAAEGDIHTVRGFLSHGVPLESINGDGSTAAYTAAAGGSVPVLQLLIANGANLNSINSFGDSPLEAATENRHYAAEQLLRTHGAVQIKGTPEQRNAASHAIVQRQINSLAHVP